MKKRLQVLSLSTLMVLTTGAFAHVGAVIDSGVDFSHSKLSPVKWTNIREIPDNGIDDDLNGKIDDVNGWDFEKSTGVVFSTEVIYPDDAYDSVQRFFNLQDKEERGQATENEKAERRLIAMLLGPYLDYFGTMAHGTHVAGLVSKGSPNSKIMAMKILSTDVESLTRETLGGMGAMGSKPKLSGGALRRFLMKFVLRRLAQAQTAEMSSFSTYLKANQARVANCSWGSSFDNLKEAIDVVAKEVIGEDVPAADVEWYTEYLFKKLNKRGERAMDKAPDTLFVFAAGNDNDETEHANNDLKPSYPANVDSDNTITVAATIDNVGFAAFSNYGVKTVHVGAPGVGILSTTPQNKMTKMSGTSMAAPIVSGIAMKMVEENDKLKARDLKRILIETCDKLDFMKNRVTCGGIVNEARAVKAAQLAKSKSIKKAIKLAFEAIPATSAKSLTKAPSSAGIKIQKLKGLFH